MLINEERRKNVAKTKSIYHTHSYTCKFNNLKYISIKSLSDQNSRMNTKKYKKSNKTNKKIHMMATESIGLMGVVRQNH